MIDAFGPEEPAPDDALPDEVLEEVAGGAESADAPEIIAADAPFLRNPE